MTKKNRALNPLRHLLSVGDLSSTEITGLLQRALFYKKNRRRSIKSLQPLQKQNIGLLFQKPSTRTRISFEVGIREMGGESFFLDPYSSQMTRGETLLDTLRVMERYFSGLILRYHDHNDLMEVSKQTKIPLINGLSEFHHPAQAIADVLTVKEKLKKKKPRLAYLGEGNNVTVSLIEVCSRMGWPLVVASPKNYACSSKILKNGVVIDNKTITLCEDPEKAVHQADVIYTDTWFSMSEKKKSNDKNKKKALLPYQVNQQLLSRAAPNYIFLHCLPAYRNLEVSPEIIDGPHSAVWDQAENRLHAQKAIMDFFFYKQFIL